MGQPQGKEGRLLEGGEGRLRLGVKEGGVAGGMVEGGGRRPNGLVQRLLPHGGQQFLQRAVDREGVQPELEGVEGGPGSQGRPVAEEAAGPVSEGHLLQHTPADGQLRRPQRVQHHHQIHVALRPGLPPAEAALDAHKGHPAGQGLQQRREKGVHPRSPIHCSVLLFYFGRTV